jgi:hypothetical protein
MTLPTPYLWQREVYAAWTWLIQSTPCLLLLTAHLLLGEAYRPHLPLPCGLCGFIYGRGNHLCPPLTRPPCTLPLCSSFWCHWSAQVPPPTMWSKDGPLPRWWCVTSCPLVLPVSSADRPSDQMMMEMTRTMSAGRTSTTTTGSVTTHTSALLGTQTTPCPFSTRMNHVRPSKSCCSCKRGCWTASTILVSSTTLPRAGVPALRQSVHQHGLRQSVHQHGLQQSVHRHLVHGNKVLPSVLLPRPRS